MVRSLLAVATVAVVSAGCAVQESSRFGLGDTLPDYNPTSLSSIEGAAGEGNARAARVLGDMYYWGDKVEPDRVKAEAYWVQAAEGGDEEAISRLEAYRNGQPIKVAYGGGGMRRGVMGFWNRSVEPFYDFDIDLELF
ncbi:MAG: sel1 repeat family protein [Alphaproteobacteria bacterium]|nr:sel1 repeat family protein [Alphaproteobacteria bacterium]